MDYGELRRCLRSLVSAASALERFSAEHLYAYPSLVWAWRQSIGLCVEACGLEAALDDASAVEEGPGAA